LLPFCMMNFVIVWATRKISIKMFWLDEKWMNSLDQPPIMTTFFSRNSWNILIHPAHKFGTSSIIF
jgi:hypothetical protein